MFGVNITVVSEGYTFYDDALNKKFIVKKGEAVCNRNNIWMVQSDYDALIDRIEKDQTNDR